jgi:hypothetical protein
MTIKRVQSLKFLPTKDKTANYKIKKIDGPCPGTYKDAEKQYANISLKSPSFSYGKVIF